MTHVKSKILYARGAYLSDDRKVARGQQFDVVNFHVLPFNVRETLAAAAGEHAGK